MYMETSRKRQDERFEHLLLDTERTSENACAVAERLDVKADSKALLFANRACRQYVDEHLADMQFFAFLGGWLIHPMWTSN